MTIQIDLASEVPIYQQIRDQIVSLIAKGQLQAGQALPSVRQLAVDIGVNMHTIHKAYGLLKSDGYLTADRRWGAQVANPLRLDTAAYKRIAQHLDAAACEACARDMKEREFINLCQSAYSHLKEEDS